MVQKVFEQRRVQDGLELKFLSGDRSTDDGENSRSDHRTDAERSEAGPTQGLLQALFGILRIGDELVNVLFAEELCAQSPPSPFEREKTLPCAVLPRNHLVHWRGTLWNHNRSSRPIEDSRNVPAAFSRRNPGS